MKTRYDSIRILVALAAVLVAVGSAAAQDMGSNAGGNRIGFYESVQAGSAFVQDMDINGGGSFKFNVGPKVDLIAGYNITRNIAAEFQFGFAHNGIDQFESGPLPSGFSADLWSIPLMVNGIYKYPINNRWQIYGGAGAGAVFSILGLGNSGTSLINSTDTEFGYQAIAGVKYHFNDHIEFGLGYNFLGTLDHHWTIFNSGITTHPTWMHTLLVNFTYKF